MAAARRDPHMREVLGICDGDIPEDSFVKAFGRHLQKNLSEEDLNWLKDHSSSLPGKCAPEKWIQNLLVNHDFLRKIAELLSANEEDVLPIFNAVAQFDHHDIFFELSSRLGRSVEELKNIVSLAISQTFPKEFEMIVAAVEKLLTQGKGTASTR
jgi:hypothetical protein